MKFLQAFVKKIVGTKVLLSLVLILSLLNIYQVLSPLKIAQGQEEYDSEKKIKYIEAYLDHISDDYIVSVKQLADQYHIPSWGCGPSSYALAQILNRKFFDNKLTIGPTYDETRPYEIVERFRFRKDDTGGAVDHAWLEIYLRDQVLFVDPTIAQFGKTKGIAYEVFDVGDPSIAKSLKERYGILDAKMGAVLKKTINRVPVEQEPYPGLIISQDFVDYYTKAIEVRNGIADDKIPDDWKIWVKQLTDRYL